MSPCSEERSQLLGSQQHHDASPCYDQACRFDHPHGGPFPHPCDPAPCGATTRDVHGNAVCDLEWGHPGGHSGEVMAGIYLSWSAAPPLSPEEREVVDRFEVAPDGLAEPCVGCHADHTGENIVENPDCPQHGYDEPDDVNLGSCPWYLTRGLPDSQREVCTFGCWDEPACETNEPDGGWPVGGAA